MCCLSINIENFKVKVSQGYRGRIFRLIMLKMYELLKYILVSFDTSQALDLGWSRICNLMSYLPNFEKFVACYPFLFSIRD